MNAIGPQRCMSDLARSARPTLRVHVCARGLSNAAAQQLPEVFYGMLGAAARIECQGVGDSASRPRVSLTVPCPKGMWICPKCHAPTTCAVRMQMVSVGVVRMPFDIGSSTFIVSAPASSLSQLRISSVVMLVSYRRPQRGMEERDQTNSDAFNCGGGTPGSVIGRPPQGGRLRLNAPQKPS